VFALFIISLLFGAGALGFRWWALRQRRRAQAVASAVNVPLAQLAEDAALVARELGPGSFRQEVRIRGTIVCDEPLTAELSHTPCVSYRYSVTREYEEVLWEKDAEGHSVQKTVRRSEVVASNDRSTVFWLDDGTGRIEVHPEHAKLERVKTHSSFQPAGQALEGFGLGSFLLPKVPGGTLGYRYEEEALAVGTEVTVVAEAGDGPGSLALRKPEDREAPFLVSLRSFDDLARGSRTQVAILQGLSYGFAAVAVLIFLLGVIR